MNNMKGAGSPWQRIAAERIMPILNELGTNLQSTIEHLNKNQGQLHKSAYKDYAAANAELAATLAETVSDFVNYAQSKKGSKTLAESWSFL